MDRLTTSELFESASRHQREGRLAEAEELYHQILTREPDNARALHQLGTLALQAGRYPESSELIRRAIRVQPAVPDSYANLGVALAKQDQFAEAANAFRKSLALRPQAPMVHHNLGNTLLQMGEIDEAIAAYRQALAQSPGFPQALTNLGLAFKSAGRLDEAIDCFGRAAHAANDPRLAGNVLAAIHFHPAYDARRIWQEHVAWNQAFGHPLTPRIAAHDNDRSPDRTLRLAYVSPDFRTHPVGRFLLPLLANHDRRQFHVTCYSDVTREDALTSVLRGHADAWRPTFSLADEQLAQLIRADRIDILIDLSMHMSGNRLPVFARKPAPVQVTWLAYCSTTGLETIDYRLTDPYFDPPPSTGSGQANVSYYSERSVRLPRTYWCYQPAISTPQVAPLPAGSAGHITFGCLNNYSKVSSQTWETWRRLLHDVPNSCLVVCAPRGSHRQTAWEQLSTAGIQRERVEFVGRKPIEEYFRQDHRIDIALDPFPFAGGTTTCDALWMGAPVVSLAGQTAVSRAGLSILSNVGLPELVAQSPDEYVQIATGLAADLPRLRHLRETLRSRMQSSPLMDAPQFARDVEAAFRQMWQIWCNSLSAASHEQGRL